MAIIFQQEKVMNQLIKLLIGLSITATLTSCFRKDEALTLAKPGEVKVSTVGQGSDYSNQIFFDLNDGEILKNNYAEWDLAFENSASGYRIWINGGKGVYAGSKNESNFNLVSDTLGVKWNWDSPTGNPDSTAIGNWTYYIPTAAQKPSTTERIDETDRSNSPVYIIDRGTMYNGVQRFWKVKFLWVNSDAYKLKYGLLNNTLVDSIIINKNNQYNYAYFTFNNGGQQLTVEPVKTTWDILFTRYRYVFYNTTPYTPYLVSGVLLNPTGIYAGVDSTMNFEDIDYQKAKTVKLTNERDIIGYNWKTYSFTSSSFIIVPNRNYIIRDEKGYYWKLRFIDFYNQSGEKGYPKFEYQRL
jgi:hypothetical protein